LRQVDDAGIAAVAQRRGDVGFDQHRATDPARRVGQPAAAQRRDELLQALVHLGDAGDLRELRHLGDHLGVGGRVERILGDELGRHQAQEIVLVEHAHRRRPGGRRRAGRVDQVAERAGGAGGVGHLPSLSVSSVRVLAVCSTWTLFWYWRAASTMSMSSAELSTAASQTSPFASASGLSGSWRRTGAASVRTMRSTWTVAPRGLSSTVRKTGRSARNAVSRLLAPEPALARLEAVAFNRATCADMARPAISKTFIGWAISFPLQRAPDRVDAPFEEGERGAILDGIFGEQGLLGGELDRVAVERRLGRHAV